MGQGAMVPFLGNTAAGIISPLADLAANFRIYSYLETQQLMALEGGMYKFI